MGAQLQSFSAKAATVTGVKRGARPLAHGTRAVTSTRATSGSRAVIKKMDSFAFAIWRGRVASLCPTGLRAPFWLPSPSPSPARALGSLHPSSSLQANLPPSFATPHSARPFARTLCQTASQSRQARRKRASILGNCRLASESQACRVNRAYATAYQLPFTTSHPFSNRYNSDATHALVDLSCLRQVRPLPETGL